MIKTANSLAAAFETKTRNDGSEFTALKADSPEWMIDAMRDAHDGKMPNDMSYEMIESVAYSISEALAEADSQDIEDARHERIDGLVSVYHSERFAWLASNITRADYCDMAARDGLLAPNATMSDRCAAGMYLEYEHIWNVLFNAIEREGE